MTPARTAAKRWAAATPRARREVIAALRWDAGMLRSAIVRCNHEGQLAGLAESLRATRAAIAVLRAAQRGKR